MSEQESVQEPVAWMHVTEDGNIRMWSKSSPESIEAAIGVKPVPLYTSPQPAPVPKGWKLVPVEPTMEMVFAGQDAWSEALDARLEDKEPYGEENKAPMCARAAYRAMLALATPPAAQREWVGLTDEERDELWYKFEHMKLMRAVEAKLKDKNA